MNYRGNFFSDHSLAKFLYTTDNILSNLGIRNQKGDLGLSHHPELKKAGFCEGVNAKLQDGGATFY